MIFDRSVTTAHRTKTELLRQRYQSHHEMQHVSTNDTALCGRGCFLFTGLRERDRRGAAALTQLLQLLRHVSQLPPLQKCQTTPRAATPAKPLVKALAIHNKLNFTSRAKQYPEDLDGLQVFIAVDGVDLLGDAWLIPSATRSNCVSAARDRRTALLAAHLCRGVGTPRALSN
ncbi:unnamed protein product [Spodoptera exigua]|nr:unnamed protein product [Spodoptera exigua]